MGSEWHCESFKSFIKDSYACHDAQYLTLCRPPVSSITSSLNDLNVESIHIYQTSSEAPLLHPLQAWLGLVLMLPP